MGERYYDLALSCLDRFAPLSCLACFFESGASILWYGFRVGELVYMFSSSSSIVFRLETKTPPPVP